MQLHGTFWWWNYNNKRLYDLCKYNILSSYNCHNPKLFLRSCDRAVLWHVTVHRDMWPCIVTFDRAASWYVTVLHLDMWPWCIVTNCFILKPTRCTNFSNLFCHETLHVSESSSVYHQEFIHCTLINGICHTTFEQDQDGTAVPSWSCSKAVYKPVWHIPLLSVQWINSWWWTEELSETCRVSWQNKFVKLVHLVGFITKKSKTYCYKSKPFYTFIDIVWTQYFELIQIT